MKDPTRELVSCTEGSRLKGLENLTESNKNALLMILVARLTTISGTTQTTASRLIHEDFRHGSILKTDRSYIE